MRTNWKKAKPKEEKKFKMNQFIRVPEVFLIGEDGNNIGVVSTQEALRMAQEAELDLVEVNPRGEPPVVKIMDFGQFKYEMDKKAHKQKVLQKKVEIKGLRLSVRISEHDYDFRIKQAKGFLDKGHKVKVELGLKGREKQHPEKAVEVINGFVADLEKREGLSVLREQDLTRQGGRFIIIIAGRNK